MTAALLAHRLTQPMRDGLRLLILCGCDDAFVHSGPDNLNDGGQAALGFRTTNALTRRGLVTQGHDHLDEYGWVALTDTGRDVALTLLGEHQEPARCDCCGAQAGRRPLDGDRRG